MDRRNFIFGLAGVASMSGGFNNQIIGGLSKLIRPAIQSPDYSPGVAGWTINKDGSAEFNNATFRGTVIIDSTSDALLVYNGTPAAGNLEVAISANGGTDAYGNTYTAGLYLQSDGLANPSMITMTNPPLDSGYAEIIYESGAFGIVHVPSNPEPMSFLTGGASTGVNYCSGLPGKYYFEDVAMAGQVITSGVTTVMRKSGTNMLLADYISGWGTTTTWTAPVTGIYSFTLSAGFTSWVANSEFALLATLNGAVFMETDMVTNHGSCQTVTARKYCNAGDTVQALVSQATGSNKTLGPASSCYMSIQREF